MNPLGQEIPLVDVLVLTYNHETVIEECLQSILSQITDFRYRILVHDDCSTDGTLARIKKLQKKYPGRIELVTQPENQFRKGVNVTARQLLQLKSEFLAFCEGDDYWSSTQKLQKQVEFFRMHEWAAIVHSDVTVLAASAAYEEDADAFRKFLDGDERRKVEPLGGEVLAQGNFLMTCSVMLRREYLQDEVLNVLDGLHPTDLILFALVTQFGGIGYIDEKLATYRLHSGNTWAGTDLKLRIEKTLDVMWFLSGVLAAPLKDSFRMEHLKRLIDVADITGDGMLRDWKYRLESFDSILQEQESLRQKLHSVLNSTSWKITKPMRRIKRLGRKQL